MISHSPSLCKVKFPAICSQAQKIKHMHFPGLVDYNFASKIQDHIVHRHLEHKIRSKSRLPGPFYPVVLSFQFHHVYTGGKREKSNTTEDKIELMQELKHVPYVQTSRGGQVTYHGPGQMVAYPIWDLGGYKNLNSRCYVSQLENAIVQTLKDPIIGLEGAKTTENTGVWIEDDGHVLRKISSLGVNLKRRVSSHGASINLFTELSYLNDPRFVMCGLDGYEQTSVQNELGDKFPPNLDIQKLSMLFVKNLAERVGVEDIEFHEIDKPLLHNNSSNGYAQLLEFIDDLITFRE